MHRLVYVAPKEAVPDLGGVDTTIPRAMPSALRTLRTDDVIHVPVPGDTAAIERFMQHEARSS